MSNPADIKIAHINTKDQNKGSLDKDKVFEVFQMTINDSLKHFFRMQQGWVNRAYLNFNDFDTYLILMYLMNKFYAFFCQCIVQSLKVIKTCTPPPFLMGTK